MKGKITPQIVTTVVVISILVGAISFVKYLDYRRNWYIPEYPTEELDNVVFYLIDPNNILESLDRGETDVFAAISFDSDDTAVLEWPASSFAFDHNDLMKVVHALHQFVWDESLEDWQLIRASFLMDQCQDIAGGFDYASMLYYKRKSDTSDDKYIVHGLKVDLRNGEVSAGERSFDYTGKWKGLELDKVAINSADHALSIAENEGGEKVRLAVQENCNRIDIFLAHERFEYDILSRPFNRYDYGWDITYWADDGSSLIFEIVIEPLTGKYRVVESK